MAAWYGHVSHTIGEHVWLFLGGPPGFFVYTDLSFKMGSTLPRKTYAESRFSYGGRGRHLG